MPKNKIVVSGGVDEYIAKAPSEIQSKLQKIRKAIQEATPSSVETVSYFKMPGYSYEGYDYNGMFAWFSYKKPYIRLHVRPPVINDHEKELTNYKKTEAILSFSEENDIEVSLVKKLVKASIKVMTENKK